MAKTDDVIIISWMTDMRHGKPEADHQLAHRNCQTTVQARKANIIVHTCTQYFVIHDSSTTWSIYKLSLAGMAASKGLHCPSVSVVCAKEWSTCCCHVKQSNTFPNNLMLESSVPMECVQDAQARAQVPCTQMSQKMVSVGLLAQFTKVLYYRVSWGSA